MSPTESWWSQSCIYTSSISQRIVNIQFHSSIWNRDDVIVSCIWIFCIWFIYICFYIEILLVISSKWTNPVWTVEIYINSSCVRFNDSQRFLSPNDRSCSRWCDVERFKHSSMSWIWKIRTIFIWKSNSTSNRKIPSISWFIVSILRQSIICKRICWNRKNKFRCDWISLHINHCAKQLCNNQYCAK